VALTVTTEPLYNFFCWGGRRPLPRTPPPHCCNWH